MYLRRSPLCYGTCRCFSHSTPRFKSTTRLQGSGKCEPDNRQDRRPVLCKAPPPQPHSDEIAQTPYKGPGILSPPVSKGTLASALHDTRPLSEMRNGLSVQGQRAFLLGQTFPFPASPCGIQHGLTEQPRPWLHREIGRGLGRTMGSLSMGPYISALCATLYRLSRSSPDSPSLYSLLCV